MPKQAGADQAVMSRGTRLYRETRRLVEWLALFGVVLCLAVVLLYGSLRDNCVDEALAGIAPANRKRRRQRRSL